MKKAIDTLLATEMKIDVHGDLIVVDNPMLS